MEKTFAYLIDPKNPALLIGWTKTTAKGGELVSYGEWLPEKEIFHEIGRAKVTRNKKYTKHFQVLEDGETACQYDVNYGGGMPV